AASRRGSTSSLTSGGVSGVGRSGRRGVAQSPFFGPLFDNDSAATLEEPEAGVAGSANNTEAAASRRELFDLTGQLFVRFGVLAAGSPSPPGGGAAANVYTECNSSELSAAAASAVSTASGSRRHRQKAASRSKGERDEHDSDVTAAVDPDLVLLESGLRHLARLTRCLALPTGGHAILASATPGVGRSTLTRLAARMSLAQTQPVCLLISSAALAASGGSDAIDVVVATMRDGACPGLFDVATDSSSEAKSKATAAASTQPAFQLAVRSNLRCVLSLNWRDSKLGSLHSVLSRHPELLHACQCIDWYSDWSQDTYAAVARHWLESGAFDLSLTTATSAKTESIVAATAQAAAAAHVTAGRMLSGLYAGLSPESPMLPTQATPLAFKEFLSLATGLAGDLRRAAIRDIEAGSSLADSISAEQATLDAQKLEAEAARPKLEAQLWDVEMQAQAIQQQREKYKAQLDACREQEAKVKQLLEPLEKMKKESQDSGQAKLDPVYEAAIRAAESLQPQHLEEVRSYREPPEPVKAVMSVICMLFDTETESWEAAKELMMKEDLQELLLYYDKASMPDSKFKRLTAALSRPEMSEMAVSSASKAAAKVRDWLEAVQQFTAVSRDLNPAIGALRAAEERVSREQTRLGRMRVEAQKQLESLNAAIGLHREASLAARQLRQRIARMQVKLLD
uniref:ATPase_AAA_core domain-containing protein n=1 Tax=Macrostomum lignano TaxID=282301 RepID=A0A1I8GTQ9_9PLAT